MTEETKTPEAEARELADALCRELEALSCNDADHDDRWCPTCSSLEYGYGRACELFASRLTPLLSQLRTVEGHLEDAQGVIDGAHAALTLAGVGGEENQLEPRLNALLSQLREAKERVRQLSSACTCGSGAHPRECGFHGPLARKNHVLELNYENAVEGLKEAEAQVSALTRERDTFRDSGAEAYSDLKKAEGRIEALTRERDEAWADLAAIANHICAANPDGDSGMREPSCKVRDFVILQWDKLTRERDDWKEAARKRIVLIGELGDQKAALTREKEEAQSRSGAAEARANRLKSAWDSSLAKNERLSRDWVEERAARGAAERQLAALRDAAGRLIQHLTQAEWMGEDLVGPVRAALSDQVHAPTLRVLDLERQLAALREENAKLGAIAERCRTSKGPCFCGMHVSPVMEAALSPATREEAGPSVTPQERAEQIVDAWEAAEGESMREGHRATLEDLIAAALSPAMGAGGEPKASVGGQIIERSIEGFVRACEALIAEEQEQLLPRTYLISVLCDAVRLVRELERRDGAGPAMVQHVCGLTGFDPWRHGDVCPACSGEGVEKKP